MRETLDLLDEQAGPSQWDLLDALYWEGSYPSPLEMVLDPLCEISLSVFFLV
jgi:hypothetical protein